MNQVNNFASDAAILRLIATLLFLASGAIVSLIIYIWNERKIHLRIDRQEQKKLNEKIAEFISDTRAEHANIKLKLNMMDADLEEVLEFKDAVSTRIGQLETDVAVIKTRLKP